LTVGVAALRVLIADDHRLFAKTVEALLAGEPDLEVVAVAGDGLEALRLATSLLPDLVLMDVDMPRLDGLTATARLRALLPATAVIVLTSSLDPAHSARAFQAGAAAYVTKDRIATALLPAIRAATGAPGRLSADGGADVAGGARVG
jgi:two-component system, NarL family, response regulator DesR